MQLHQAIFRQYLWKKIGSELIWFNERGERNQTKVNSEQNFQLYSICEGMALSGFQSWQHCRVHVTHDRTCTLQICDYTIEE